VAERGVDRRPAYLNDTKSHLMVAKSALDPKSCEPQERRAARFERGERR